MSIEERCAERFDEGTGGYLVCVDETRRHDATVELFAGFCGFALLMTFLILTYRLIRKR